jgi:predicted DNA binding protein/PAS domain-containing protein
MSQTPRDRSFFEEVVLEQTTGILTVDEEGTVVYANERATRAIDAESAAVVTRPLTEFFFDTTITQIEDVADGKTETERLEATVRTEGQQRRVTEWTVATTETDGSRFYTLTLGADATGGDGGSGGVLDRQLDRLFDTAGEPLALFDPADGTLLACNRQTRERLGLPASASMPMSVRAFVDAPAVFSSFLQDVRTADEGRREEFTLEVDQETRAIELVATPIERGGEQFVFARIDDVTERNLQRAQRRRRTAALEAVHDGVALLDTTYEHGYVNEAYADLVADGARETVTGEPLTRYVEPDDRFEEEIRPALERDGRWHGQFRCGTAAETTTVDAVFETLEDGAVVLVVRAATNAERAPREPPSDRLSALTETRERLLAARDAETVASVCIDTVTDGYGYDLACFRLETDNELAPAVLTSDASALVDANPGFELGRSDAGRAYRTGEAVVRESESDTATGDLLSTSLHLPVGEHGVLTVATADRQSVPPAVIDALQLLAVSAETVLDRIELERSQDVGQSSEGGQVTESTALTQEIVREIIGADSRSAAKQQVCSKLVSTDCYDGAWVADVDATGERLEMGETAGLSDETATAIDETPLSSVADGSVTTVIETGEPSVVNSASLVTGSGATGDSVVMVPLSHGDKLFGVLAAHVSNAEAFDLIDKRSLAVLGKTLGFVLGALENERLLLSDEFVQLEFQVTDPSCLSVVLSDKLDTSVTMRRTIQKANDEYLSYVRIEDTAPAAAVEAAESTATVHDCRVINDHEYGCLLEVTRSSSGAEVMMEYGATVRRADAESARGTLILEAPHTADVREIVQAYQSYNPQSELVSKRRVDRPLRTADQLRSEIEGELTEKQLSAVSTAYFSGYYEWPRESTAEEIADSIGISASTLHQHLRHAHRKLLTAILEESFSRRF